MASIARINLPSNAHNGKWAIISRKGRNNVRVTPLDGSIYAGILVPSNALSSEFECSNSQIDRNNGSFRRFPVRIYGPRTPGNSSGSYTIRSVNDDALVATGSNVGNNPPVAPINNPPVAPINNPPVAFPRPRVNSRVGVGISAASLSAGNSVPVIAIDQLSIFMDAVPINQSLMIWGPSGVGKSDGVQQYCSAHNLKLFDLRLPLLEPIDLRGVGAPDLERGLTRWLPPDFLPKEPGCCLLLDEISSAVPVMQSAAYQLTLDRRCGNWIAPPDLRIVGAGNRISDRGVAYQMPAPLANRFMHFEIKVNIAAWRSWAFRNNIDPRIISFLTLHPEFLHKMDSDGAGQAWPSPRSWARSSPLMRSNRFNDRQKGQAVAAFVGSAVTRELVRHCQVYAPLANMVAGILGGTQSSYREDDPTKCQILAVAVVDNCLDNPQQMENAIRWGISQTNREWTSLLVRGMEAKFGEDNLEDVGAYNEYCNPGRTPRVTSSRVVSSVGAQSHVSTSGATRVAPPDGF